MAREHSVKIQLVPRKVFNRVVIAVELRYVGTKQYLRPVATSYYITVLFWVSVLVFCLSCFHLLIRLSLGIKSLIQPKALGQGSTVHKALL